MIVYIDPKIKNLTFKVFLCILLLLGILFIYKTYDEAVNKKKNPIHKIKKEEKKKFTTQTGELDATL